MKRTTYAGCMIFWMLGFSSAGFADEDSAAALHDLFAREWEHRLAEDPLLATSVGRHEYDDLLPDVTPEAQARRAGEARAFLDELAAIERESLSVVDRVSYDMFRRQLELRVVDVEHGDYEIPLNADSGFQTEFARLPNEMPLDSIEGYEDYLARLRAFPAYVDQQIANMRRGLGRGMSLPRVVLEGIEVTMAAHIVGSHRDSAFWKPFDDFPVSVPERDRERLCEEAAAAIEESIVPAYRTLLDFMVGEYIPGTRESLGARDLPEGIDYYRHKIREFTTLDLAPEEIHRIGLGEVARIRAEMEAVIEEVGFEGPFDEFLAFLRTESRFYAGTPDALLKEAAWIAKRMEGRLPSLFGRLPRLPYTVEAVPEYLAPKYTTGRYVGAPWGSTEPGRYWVNTYNLTSRPLYNLEALTLHEAVPGHHLQIALSQEIEGLPPFRRFSYISAFGEGWGLYAEWLGLEAGFYTDPYSNFGRLTYEMWRACRLVVDTGVHALGWSRERMVDFLASNTALPLHEVETEIDRYISWPGQALSYKLGEIEIRKLRRKAEQALGGSFDVRAFHDTVLGNGSVPLPVLRDAVERFVQAER